MNLIQFNSVDIIIKCTYKISNFSEKISNNSIINHNGKNKNKNTT